MPSKPAGSVRPAKRSTAGSQLGGRPAAKNVARPVARPSVTPKPAMGAIPSRPIASPKPSLGAKVTRPGRALGASKPRMLTSVSASAKPQSGKKGSNPLSSIGAWQIMRRVPLLPLRARVKSWAASLPLWQCLQSLPSSSLTLACSPLPIFRSRQRACDQARCHPADRSARGHVAVQCESRPDHRGSQAKSVGFGRGCSASISPYAHHHADGTQGYRNCLH